MKSSTPVTPMAPPARPSAGRNVLGLLLLLPAFACCALTQAIPLGQTVWMSFLEVSVFGGVSRFVGLDAYGKVLSDPGLLPGAGNSLIGVLVRIAAVAIVPPLLGWAAGALGPRVRGASALALSAGWTLAIPAVLALITVSTLGQLRRMGLFMPDPTVLGALIWGVDGVATLVMAAGLSLLAYGGLAGSPGSRRLVAGVWVASLLLAFASAWQDMAWPLVVTGGNFESATLPFLAYTAAFRNMQFGLGSALNVIVALPVVLAGLLMVVGVALSRPAIEMTPAEPVTGRGLPWVLFALAGLVVLMAAVALTTWVVIGLFAPSGPDLFERLPMGELILATVAPPFVTALIQALVTVPAAFAIGRLRPLGQHSLWLLLPFAPFLMLGSGATALAWFQTVRDLELIGNWFTATDLSLNVAVLVLLALYFRGQAARQPGWLTAGVVAAALLASTQGAFFDLTRQLVFSGPSTPTLLVAALQMAATRAAEAAPTGPLLAALAAFIVLWWPLTGLVLARLRVVQADD